MPSPADVDGNKAPALPDPAQSPDDDGGDYWEPTDELPDPAEDSQPWLHDWAGWISGR